jgi:hypothetical protein
VHNEVFKFLIEHGKLSKQQGAFIPGRSTTSQLVELYNFILEEMDRGKECRFIFCDVSKAFDRVWHKGLLYKLERAGIKGNLLKWFESYLKNRRQKVVLNGVESSMRDILAGVPQGSILGPLLFLIYINDLVDVVHSNSRLYADDATIYIDFRDADRAADLLEDDLNQMMNWATRWLVSFNPQKTESVTFSRKRVTDIPQISMGGTVVAESNSHKHLGIQLQCNGKWSEHIQEITLRAKKKVDILRGMTYMLDRRALEKMYIT